MLKALALYGPDELAQSGAESIAVGRCLTSLLPEDVFDVQPIKARGALLVADLRLDNRDELIASLRLPREWARTAADSAILFEALELWGDETPNHLVGDYAYAFCETQRQRLTLVRDPLGERPLHYHAGAGLFAFASMPKGLHALPAIPCAPDLTRLAHRIAQVRPVGNRSFYAGITRVEPGHMVVVTRAGVQTRRHWRPQRSYLNLERPEDYAAALCDVLDRAVASRLRGAGDVASHLSGGLDSTSVTASAARLQAARHRRVIALTAAPRADYRGADARNRFGDESRHAAAVAGLYANVDHVVLRTDDRNPLDDLDDNLRLYDKPMLNPCNAVWAHRIFAAVQERGIRVMLSGDTGNATISYKGRELFAETFARGDLWHWAREGAALTRLGWGRWRGVLKDTLEPWLPAHLRAPLQWGHADSDSAVGRRVPVPVAQANGFARLRRAAAAISADAWNHRVDWFARMDHGNEYLGALAGWGIDRRDPTADRRVIEFCLAVPTEQYLRDGVPAALLRRAMADRLPAMVLNERRKGLQSPDWHEPTTLARGAILAEIDRLEACGPVADHLDIPRLRAAVENWPTEGWERPETAHLRTIVLRSVSAGHFVRRVLDDRR